MESVISFCEISSMVSVKQNYHLVGSDIPKEGEDKAAMEDEHCVFIKEEPVEMNDMEDKDGFLCASQDPISTSTPVKYEDLDDDTINRSFHIPPGSFLISRPVNYEEENDRNISRCASKGKFLISTPLNCEETFNEPNSANQSNKTEPNDDDVKIFPTLLFHSKRFQCQSCTKAYSRKSHLMLHMRTHTGEKRFKCKQCDARFTYRHVLEHHELVHSGVKPYVCELCGDGFTKPFNLKSHLSRVHFKGEKLEPIERKFKCNTCVSKFVRRSALKVHELSHSSDKPFECNTCGRKYKYKQCLRKHVSTHDMSNTSSKIKCDIS